MTKQLVKMLATVSFLIGLVVITTASANAQSRATPIKVNIPFDFIVADKTCPAGEYTVRRFQQYTSDIILEISSRDGRTRLLRLTNSAQTITPKKQVTLLFHRYGDQHFLYQVWQAGSTSGRELIRSRGEQQIVQKSRNAEGLARAMPPVVETVVVSSGPQ